MITWSKGPLTFGETWYSHHTPEDCHDLDVIHFQQTSEPPVGASSSLFLTLEINLTKTPDELLSNMKKDTRRRIKRSIQKDGITYEVCDTSSPATLEKFCEFYNSWAAQKSSGKRLNASRNGLQAISPQYLQRYADAGLLDISCVLHDNAELSWHAHLLSQDRAGMFLASQLRDLPDSSQRQLAGRANRAHYWQDMVRFRDQGFSTYDFGGWYPGYTDQQKVRISDFKSEFGGTVVKQTNCYLGVTSAGKALVLARHMTKRAMGRSLWLQKQN